MSLLYTNKSSRTTNNVGESTNVLLALAKDKTAELLSELDEGRAQVNHSILEIECNRLRINPRLRAELHKHLKKTNLHTALKAAPVLCAIDKLNPTPRHNKKLLGVLFKNGANQAAELIKAVQQHTLPAAPAIDISYQKARALANSLAEDFFIRGWSYKEKIADKLDKEAQAQFEEDLQEVKRIINYKKRKQTDAQGFYKRASEPKFWVKKIQAQANQAAIQTSRILQQMGTGPGREAYLPGYVIDRKHEQIDMMNDWLARSIISSGGTIKTLFEIAFEAPVRQSHELQIRILAQAKRMKKLGCIAFFVTVTPPSRMHSARLARWGKNKGFSEPNPKFDPAITPGLAADWLQKSWQNFRALMNEHQTQFSYFGAQEPHKDGTPHRHYIIYIRIKDENILEHCLKTAFLYSDEPDEPGAREHRIKIEKEHTNGGVQSYISKLLAYPLKTLNTEKEKKGEETNDQGDKPAAESLFNKAIGKRTFYTSADFVGIWRWLRACDEASAERFPAEMKAAWHAAHGTGSETTKPEHYLIFLESGATQYKPAFRMEDYYDIEYKTIDDFDSYEEYKDAYLEFCHTDDYSLVAKLFKRKLNRYGEPAKPSLNKAPLLYKANKNSRPTLISRKVKHWEKEHDEESTNEQIAALIKTIKARAQAKKEAKNSESLQLFIQGQGAETRASTGFEVSTDLESWENSAIEATNADFTSPAPPPH